MKKVVKVSIANMAFTIDEDGYELLKAYLGELNAHYKFKQNGDEIIEGIEERMADLFIEKSGKDTVISMEVVKEVINILGRPEIIDEEAEGANYEPGRQRDSKTVQKRVFRDMDNKVLGGVCSGLAAYFNMDTVLLRIIFIVFLVGFSVLGFHFGGGSFMVLTYIILWIVIPEAKTIEDKCAMHGESPDLSHIQRRVEDGMNQVGSSIKKAGKQSGAVLEEIIKKVVGIMLVLISLSGILSLSFLLLGSEIIEGFIPLDVINYVAIGLSSAFWFKLTILLVLFLPLIGMLYGGVQLLFGFKIPKFRPGLIIFMLWIVSCIAVVIMTVQATKPYWNHAKDSTELQIRNDIDTLYVKFVSENEMPRTNVFFDADKSEASLLWVEGKRKDHRIVAFPKIDLIRQNSDDSSMVYKIYMDVNTSAYTYGEAITKAQSNAPSVELKDSLLTIRADIYDKTHKWDGTYKKLSIYVPEKVKVILQEPIRHNFDSDSRINYNKFRYRNHSKWLWLDDEFDWD